MAASHAKVVCSSSLWAFLTPLMQQRTPDHLFSLISGVPPPLLCLWIFHLKSRSHKTLFIRDRGVWVSRMRVCGDRDIHRYKYVCNSKMSCVFLSIAPFGWWIYIYIYLPLYISRGKNSGCRDGFLQVCNLPYFMTWTSFWAKLLIKVSAIF